MLKRFLTRLVLMAHFMTSVSPLLASGPEETFPFFEKRAGPSRPAPANSNATASGSASFSWDDEEEVRIQAASTSIPSKGDAQWKAL